ncbi:MAG: pantoate--beta-alanine ligase [Nocardioidaceae bacterium]
MTPTVARTRDELGTALKDDAGSEQRIVLVPTMGALHDGHLALLHEARLRGSKVVVSIFVNPTQFGPGEDFERYPRSLEADLAVCAQAGADAVFTPVVDEIYPGGETQVTIDPGPLGGDLEGAVRPTHFAGVLTVVAKLFGLVRPDVAVFGQKDYQQLVLIRRMVTDLCLDVDVVGGETVREADGLALSSRNRYLSKADRATALALSRALQAGAQAGGTAADVLAAAQAVLDAATGLDVDYLALRTPDLAPAPESGEARLLVAGRVGTTRLIDNLPLVLTTSG